LRARLFAATVFSGTICVSAFFQHSQSSKTITLMARGLTNRQQQLVEFLRESHATTGIMPSSREIQHHFGFASQTAAMDLLRALERKGAIQRLAGKARAVMLPRGTPEEEAAARLDDLGIRQIPLLGSIAAGMPQDVTAGETDETLRLDFAALGIPRSAKTFALKVRGDSMIDAHIVPGDIVILEFREPRNGDIVAALIDGETTLKRYISKGASAPFLRAENPKYPELIPARELVIQGVMLGLVRGHRQAA
jgi:repressor LexA